MIYIYDVSGAPIGMAYRDSTYVSGDFDIYLFAKNIQGDILYIYNTSGTRLVTYTYDAWGVCYAIYQNGGASTAAQYNPFRYRGYYYDTETGFYYLNSRYYDPAVGRFLNADVYINANGDILGFNMFAYCGNNPVNRSDELGMSWLSEKWNSIKEKTKEAGNKFIDRIVHSTIRMIAPGSEIIRIVHYSRNILNDPELAIEEGEELGKDESKFHQNNLVDGKDNTKKVVKGWFSSEVVLFSDGEINNTPEDIGTFNVYYGDNEFLKYTVHAIFDVIPYMIWGNSDDDSTTIIDRIKMGLQ